MTYIFEKTFGKFDSSTDFEGNKLIVEYVHSSVSDSIKVVQMWRDGLDDFGKPAKGLRHEMYWMSEEAQDTLMKELEADMEDRMCGTLDDVTVGTEVDLDRDMPGFEGTWAELEDMVDNHVGEPEFLGGR